MFQFLGATGLSVRVIDGKSPVVMLTNLVDTEAPCQETLEKFLGRELKTRYLNPKWIDAMINEGYAGARFINKMVFNLWGWEATLPESVSDNDWNQIYDTYITDKYQLNIKERFKKSGNLFAYQSMLSRMIETARKGYWQVGDSTLNNMLIQFNETIKEIGLSCNLNVCNNEKLIEFIIDKLETIPSLSSEEKKRYRDSLNNLRKVDQGIDDSKPDIENRNKILKKPTLRNLNTKIYNTQNK